MRVLQTFADHIAQNDPITAHVLFDLAYVPAPDEADAAVKSLMQQVRRIGIGRFLFGSDFNVLSPSQEIAYLHRLGLTPDEENLLRGNCAPWACKERADAPCEIIYGDCISSGESEKAELKQTSRLVAHFFGTGAVSELELEFLERFADPTAASATRISDTDAVRAGIAIFWIRSSRRYPFIISIRL